jgi:hypothetical protein
METEIKSTRLDRSHESAYLKKYQGKKFKVRAEIDLPNIEPNIYTLGSLTRLDQMVTIDWWKAFEDRKEQHSVEYRLAEVLKNIILNNWIIINK